MRPILTRFLYHDRPRANDWPPERGIVDRDLDLAISQFAPRSETVKDGIIHTAVGVVHFAPSPGGPPAEQRNPLGPAIPIGLCNNCQAVDARQPPGPNCPACNATPQDDPAYRTIDLSQPLGFRTLWGANRDFDGIFEWTPRASRPKTGADHRALTVRRNFGVWCNQGTVYVVNDNNGRGFNFEKLAQGETWATREAVDQVRAQQTGAAIPNFSLNVPSDLRALASIKTTDVLVVGISQSCSERAHGSDPGRCSRRSSILVPPNSCFASRSAPRAKSRSRFPGFSVVSSRARISRDISSWHSLKISEPNR
jgi:DEAD/DEAH box helicase domain-containing protein